jgi:glutamate carboxypeptidase
MSHLSVSDFDRLTLQTIELLKNLVDHESPTSEKSYIDKLGKYIADRARDLNAEITTYPQEKTGDHWAFSWGPKEREFLLLTHMDTVYAVGTLNEMPWREEGEKIFGPGVLDMKFGIATALMVIEAMQSIGSDSMRGITLLCTSDEETGSETSREIIEALAQEHKLTLCLEPALPGGSLKTWRKGIGAFKIKTEGVSAHAGADPNPGVNAILEMAYQLIELGKIANPEMGISLNLGVLNGGTRTNVVAESCTCKFDVRVKSSSEQPVVEKALASLSPKLEGASVSIEGSWNRPPMQRTPLMLETFERAQSIVKDVGITLTEGGTGGGSDANFVAALGLPVLDGLGAIGEGAHSRTENIQVSCISERAAILAALIKAW